MHRPVVLLSAIILASLASDGLAGDHSGRGRRQSGTWRTSAALGGAATRSPPIDVPHPLLAGAARLPARDGRAARYVVGVRSSDLVTRADPERRGRQRNSEWCWAAISQAILNLHGVPVEQEDVVLRGTGALTNRPARGMRSIAAALDGWVTRDGLGRQRTVVARVERSLAPALLVAELAAGRPVLVGLRETGRTGHIYAITSVVVSVEDGQPRIDAAILRDPWPNSPSRIVKTWNEVERDLGGAVRIAVL